MMIANSVMAAAAVEGVTDLERLFLSVPNATMAKSHLEYYTKEVHYASSARDYDTVVWTAELWRSYGLTNVTIEEFPCIVSLPVSASVSITSPPSAIFNCSLTEDIIESDPSTRTSWRNRTWAGGAPSGDVEAPLVYLNYGHRDDYLYINQRGIAIVGSIGIVRYGKNTRSDKLREACTAGLVGLLVYSDPYDDGFARGAVYPDGPWRQESSVQRGNFGTAVNCPDLVAEVLSYRDAVPLLRAITNGELSPASWHGALSIAPFNVSYIIGPGPATVRMNIVNNNFATLAWNVIGTIPGVHTDARVASQRVLVGNHHDAWLHGAVDPSSGSAAMNEMVRGFGVLLATGWRPQRTITFASWDAEEIGLVGAANYTARYGDTIDDIVAYLNVDIAVSGPNLTMMGVPSLHQLVRDCASVIGDPYDASAPEGASEAAALKHMLIERWDDTLIELGGGSDFGPLFNGRAVASLDLGFRPVSGDGQYGDYGAYHSTMDSFAWMSTVGDPTYLYHRATAQLWGLLTLKLSESRLLPFVLADYASAIVGYVNDTKYAAIASLPSSVSPAIIQQLDTLDGLASRVLTSATRVDSITHEFTQTNDASLDDLRAINDRLRQFEHQWYMPAGLPERSGQRHALIATNPYASYYAEVLPLITDAIRLNASVEEITQRITNITVVFDRVIIWLDQPLPSRHRNGPDAARLAAIIVPTIIGSLMIAYGILRIVRYYSRPTYTEDEQVILDDQRMNGAHASSHTAPGYQRVDGYGSTTGPSSSTGRTTRQNYNE